MYTGNTKLDKLRSKAATSPTGVIKVSIEELNSILPVKGNGKKTFQEELLKCMVDMVKESTDTYWVNDGETLWERMSSIYLRHGGSLKSLMLAFPDVEAIEVSSDTWGAIITKAKNERT